MGGTLTASAVAVRTIESGSTRVRPMGTAVTLGVSSWSVAVPRLLHGPPVATRPCPARIAAGVTVDQPAAPDA